ncbi:MAG TPA: MraY family glycosyltransferase [Pirellulales bacterium]|nr:MraY family glycosyltransferase [Pirellulales bacterium]
MSWLIVGGVVPSLIVSLLAAYLVRRWAPRLGLVDRPGHRKVHTTPTPLGGGLALFAGIVLPLAGGCLILWLSTKGIRLPEIAALHAPGILSQAPKLWFLLGGGFVLVVLGLIDDRRGLDWRVRLLVQTAVAGALVWRWEGWRLSLYLLDQPWITISLSVLWIVGLINSFNMLDNMDGLSAGVAAIAAAMLVMVLLTTPDPITRQPQLFVAGFLLVLTGSLLGFLWHNRPPARLFMGDAGSYLVGYCLATATSMATFTGGNLPPHTILAPLCILAVPLYDTTTVVFIRLRQGRSPFEGDKNHFSHRLVDLGMSKGQAVLTIYLVTATCGLAGLLLHQVDAAGAVVVVLQVLAMMAVICVLEMTGRKKQRGSGATTGDAQ